MKRIFIWVLFLIILVSNNVKAGENPPSENWNSYGQATAIYQAHPSFPAKYSGPNSLSDKNQGRETITGTAFLGYRLWSGAELYFNPEIYQGMGLSNSYGVAGFPNGEASKAGANNFKVATSRLFLRQIVGFGEDAEFSSSAPNNLAGKKNLSNLTFTAGKFSPADIFDNNSYSHDPRTQFLNWSLMSSGAWDFPADSRGYSNGLVLELNQPFWSLRYGAFLEPRVQNGKRLAYHGTNSMGHVAELEERYKINNQPGKIRFLTFFNQSRQGNFKDALGADDVNAAIEESRKYGNKKYGFAINAEQQIKEYLGAFMRLSWNDGQTEDWAFTQIDRSFASGLSIKGTNWQRSDDTVGIAVVINEISKDQRRFLEQGGQGLIIGDGNLNYQPEIILENYYAIKIAKNISLTPDYQLVFNPAYNKDRGPVNVFSIRLHCDF